MYIPPYITKRDLLEKIPEEAIFEAFGLRVRSGLFCSPLRDDRHPTCEFRKRNNRIRMVDYSGHFSGDCFDFIMRKYGVNYPKAISMVAEKFGILESKSKVKPIPVDTRILEEKEVPEIRVKRMKWTPEHTRFWDRWDFRRDTLDKFYISPLECAWLNKSQVFWYGAKKEVAFIYHFGRHNYKLYFPFRVKARFLHNNGKILQGYYQLPSNGEFLVVTKSLKDVAKLYEFGIPAVAPMSEGQILSDSQYTELSSRFKHVFSLYDIDKLNGVRSMQKMKKIYGITPLFFPKGMPKDFTDFYEKAGCEATIELINYTKEVLL